MKKAFLYLLAGTVLVFASIAFWSCNNGGGEEGGEDPCDSTTGARLMSGEYIVLEITNSREANGKYEIKRLPDTTTRTAEIRAAVAVICDD